jgi:UDP-N-acetylmuramoylalanine--D-glutamate ligase
MSAALKMTMATNQQCKLQAMPTLIVGLGQTGLSCARFLARCGVPFAVTDSRAEPPAIDILRAEQKEIAIRVGGFDAALFDWAQRLVVSPGVSLNEPLIVAARQRGVEIVGDIDLFARVAKAPIAAITGANGKSTVTLLLAEMVKAAGKVVRVGGNIGTPALDLLEDTLSANSLPAKNEPDCYVLELSSFQLDTTHSLHAAAAVVLNVSPDHMDRYADLAQYTASKQSIFNVPDAAAGQPGVAVINRDDPLVAVMSTFNRRVVSFGLDAPSGDNFGRVLHQGQYWLVRGDQRLLPVNNLRIAGEHNQANALAALALGEALGLPMSSMLEALKTFTGLPHRVQFVAEAEGITWLNDSKGTNVGATLAAIQGLAGPIVLIAGGQGKGADFSPLREPVKEKVRAVIVLGEDAALIEKALAGVVPVQHVSDMSSAVKQAQTLAQPGDKVLLSPACASFDMFKGFADRGDIFMAAVRDAIGGGAR